MLGKGVRAQGQDFYQIRLNNQIIVGAGLGISFSQYRNLNIKTRPLF
jgi:hypothetical protein